MLFETMENNLIMKNRAEMMRGVFLVVLLLAIGPVLVDAKEKTPPAAKSPATSSKTDETLAPMDQPLIIVDGIGITSRQYASFLQSNPNVMRRAVDSEAGKKEALIEMVSIYVLRKAMYDEGLLAKEQANPSQQELLAAYEKLAERHFPVPPNPDESQSFAFYQSHPALYGIPEMTRLSQIFFKVAPGADDAVVKAVKERAEAALKRLENKEAFAEVASALTENPIGKVAKGDIGFQEVDKEAWMREALKGVKVGSRTGVVRSPGGFEILEVTDLRPGLVSPYANVREQVVKELRDQEQKKVRDVYVKGLATKMKIEVVHPAIKPLFPNGIEFPG